MNLQGPNMKSFPPWNPKKSSSKSSTSSSTSTFYTNSGTGTPKTARLSTLNIRHSNVQAHVPSDPQVAKHCEIEYTEEDCAITSERLKLAHDTYYNGFKKRESCFLTSGEKQMLQKEQTTIRKSLFIDNAVVGSMRDSIGSANKAMGDSIKTSGNLFSKGMSGLTGGMARMGMTVKDQMQSALRLVDEDSEEEEDEEETSAADKAPPQSQETKPKNEVGRGTLKAQFMTAKLRARLDDSNDGVLGIQSTGRRMDRFNSIRGNKYMMYNMKMVASQRGGFGSINSVAEDVEEKEEEEKNQEMDLEDISYVRKPNLARIIEEYEAMQNHPKYHLKQIVLSRRFHLYAHRFGNAQYQRTLVYPTLRQPEELYSCPWLCRECKEGEEQPLTEKTRTRTKGHRFIIAADTQFGILMDGFAMDFPNWSQEIEISRKCVAQINNMTGEDRPLYVCVCGDLVDTESSFSGAIASWKKVMSGWERNLVFEQQVKDFKRVWAGLDPDIALVCLCGNHDVGNRPTRASINHWTSAFGDDFLSFWVNGTFNICLNNCLFSNPSGAPDLYEEQLQWMENQLKYARENDATHIFVYGHFPWFLKHEEEADDFLTSYSAAPEGWGPPGSSFADSYFTIPLEQRKVAMALFKEYNVTACFSGHFHQNVVAQTSWGMPMIVTGPLSMNLSSDISNELSKGEKNGIGMRVVDVRERGEFYHQWMLLDDEEELYEHAMDRCLRQAEIEEEEKRDIRNSLFDMTYINEEKSDEEEKEDDGTNRVSFEEGDDDIDRVHLTLTPQESQKWFSSINLNIDSDGSDSDCDEERATI